MNIFESWLRGADPGARAITDDAGSLTYGRLLERSAMLAGAYRSRFGSGGYLLVPAEKSRAFVLAFLGASRSGNIPVPVDPEAPERVLAAIAERCGGAATLALPGDEGGDEGSDEVCEDAAPAANLPDTALVLFTSGTSGQPKGVPISWQNLRHSVTTVSGYLHYQRFPSAAIVLPLHYSYALLTQLLAMLSVGGHARIFGSFRNPIKFARAVEAEELQTFCGVPSTYYALCAIHRMAPQSMPAIRILCSAGAAMDRTMMPEIREMFPNARFYDNYGMTEATPRISYIADDDPLFAQPTCGRAIDGLEVCVVDEETRQSLADGEHGIVAIRGPNVFSGYLNDPESTRRAFTQDGFLLSGDYGYIHDGYIYINGRADDVFNVGGEKVAPLEIERALAEHPAIITSAVSKVEDEKRGTLCVAYLQTNGSLRRKEIVEFLRQRLAPAKIPQRYLRVSDWPMTGNGKLQRSRLSPQDSEFVIGELD